MMPLEHNARRTCCRQAPQQMGILQVTVAAALTALVRTPWPFHAPCNSSPTPETKPKSGYLQLEAIRKLAITIAHLCTSEPITDCRRHTLIPSAQRSMDKVFNPNTKGNFRRRMP